MQRFLWPQLFPIFFLLPVAAGNDLVLEQTAGDPGRSAEAILRFVPSPEQVTALQFDIEFDKASLELIPVLGDALRNPLKNLYVADIAEGKRFVMAGLNQNAVLEGPLLRLLLHARQEAAAGTYGLRITRVLLSHPNGLTAEGRGGTGNFALQPAEAPKLHPTQLFNAAGMVTGGVSPGEIVTLLAPGVSPDLPVVPVGSAPSEAELGGMRLFFDDWPAPLLYAGPNQINAIVPFGVAGRTSSELRVVRAGIPVAAMSVPVQAAKPAVFTLNSSGAGQAAALNADGTVNGPENAAERGSYIAIFATGGGQMSPEGRDGSVGEGIEQRPVLPVTVWVDGIAAEVSYAGAAPGLIAGALQINCRIPELVEAGAAVKLIVQVGDMASPAGVTVAIR